MPSNVDFANAAPGVEGFNRDHPAAAHCQILNRETGEIDLMGRKKFAICGFASSSRHHIPFDNPSFLILGLNQIYRHFPRVDVHFDIHTYWDEFNVEGTDHPKWIRECGIPVFMSDLYAASPTSVRYPVERLIAKHGIDYFTSTVAFMLAWAIDCIDREVAERARVGIVSHGEQTLGSVAQDIRNLYAEYELGIFGIDMIVGTEYEVQKACVEFWMGVAEGRGIKFSVPPECALLKQQYRYGYEREPGTGLLKMSELMSRKSELEKIKAQLIERMHSLQGALQTLQAVKATLNGQTPEPLDAKIAELTPILEKTVAELQTYDGAFQECQHVLTVLELRVRGGVIPLQQFAS